ncbi:MAG TPA: helix-turn-helix domain-containing protein [Acidimicrobiales bacterium]
MQQRAGEVTPEAQAERAKLMDAALKVMKLNGFQGASVQDILDEAGLSTRAFYRQFRSKDDLLLAMFRTASARDVEAVVKRVANAAGPLEGLHAWIDEMTAIAFDRRRLSRMVMFNVSARQAVGFDEECDYMRERLTSPLADSLRTGLEDGSFPSARPEDDANTIFDLLWSVAGPVARRGRPLDRQDARSYLLRFALPALRSN